MRTCAVGLPQVSTAMLAGWLFLAAAPAAARAPERVGKVEVRTSPLFSAAEAARGGAYRFFNTTHVATPASLIRKFLLFREGDPFVPAKLAESERNLRALDFIKTATITAKPPHGGIVDVVVETQDTWTTDLNGDLAHVQGVDTYSVDLTQKDLFGSGADASVTYDKDVERRRRAVEVSTPALGGLAYWTGDLLVSRNSDGAERRVAFGRPLASLSHRWSLLLELDRLSQRRHLYQLGAVTDVFRQRHRDANAELDFAVTASEERSRRLLGGFSLIDDRFGRGGGPPAERLPDNRRLRYFYLGYADEASDYLKMAFVNGGLKVEDFNLGRQVSLRLGVSPRSLDLVDRSFLVRAAARQGRRWGAEGFLLSSLRFDTRLEDGRTMNEISGADLLAVRRLPSPGSQTLVGRVDWVHGVRLDRDVQFFADGTDGLRAYPVRAYAGSTRLLINLEDRWFLGREVLQVVAPGAAAFLDAGSVEGAGVPRAAQGFKADIGAGLRFGIARADFALLRLDWAYRLVRDPAGRRGFVLSFGTTQAF